MSILLAVATFPGVWRPIGGGRATTGWVERWSALALPGSHGRAPDGGARAVPALPDFPYKFVGESDDFPQRATFPLVKRQLFKKMSVVVNFSALFRPDGGGRASSLAKTYKLRLVLPQDISAPRQPLPTLRHSQGVPELPSTRNLCLGVRHIVVETSLGQVTCHHATVRPSHIATTSNSVLVRDQPAT